MAMIRSYSALFRVFSSKRNFNFAKHSIGSNEGNVKLVTERDGDKQGKVYRRYK